MRGFTCTAAIAAAVTVAGCGVHQTQAPPLAGPSTFAYATTVTAVPDTVTQDGGSQAKINVTMNGPDGRPVAAQAFRVDMMINNVVQDFGTLSARTIVTGNDGVASVIYTAPPAPVGGTTPTCGSLPGTCVQIVATPTGPPAVTDSQTANSQFAVVRLVPQGVILPPAGTPTAAFTVTPTPVNQGNPVTFDASSSCPVSLVNNACPPGTTSTITSYAWTFGDGSTGSGKTLSHTFANAGTYAVTLTVTNDRGIAQSMTQQVPVGTVAGPTAAFAFSPAAPGVGDTVFFSGATSTASAGRTITSYQWSFGDGATGSGITATHAYVAAGTYSVLLTVTDSAGVSATSTAQTVAIGSPPAPTANFTFSPTGPVIGQAITFDASSSTGAQGQALSSMAWNFGDGTPVVNCPSDPSCNGTRLVSHTYSNSGTYTVNLVVADSAGRIGSHNATITVGSGNPIPSFIVNPGTPTHGFAATFDASGTQVFGTGVVITTYQWNFGDGTTSTNGPTASKTYGAASGPSGYSVTLTVIDSVGRRGSITQTIVVQ